jgi:hypothetical protein
MKLSLLTPGASERVVMSMTVAGAHKFRCFLNSYSNRF